MKTIYRLTLLVFWIISIVACIFYMVNFRILEMWIATAFVWIFWIALRIETK